MMRSELFPESIMPYAWLDEGLSEAELIRRLIEVGDSLVRVCDVVDQPTAGNYIAMALDILRADSDLKADIGPIA